MTPIALTDIRLQAVKDAARHIPPGVPPSWRGSLSYCRAVVGQGGSYSKLFGSARYVGGRTRRPIR